MKGGLLVESISLGPGDSNALAILIIILVWHRRCLWRIIIKSFDMEIFFFCHGDFTICKLHAMVNWHILFTILRAGKPKLVRCNNGRCSNSSTSSSSSNGSWCNWCGNRFVIFILYCGNVSVKKFH